MGSAAVPVKVSEEELTQAGTAVRATVGGVVSMLTVLVTEVVLPATSVAVKVKVQRPSLEWPAVSIPEGKGL